MSVNNVEINNKVLHLVSKQFDIECDETYLEKNLQELNAHYLDKVELVMRIEDEFGIQISDDEVDTLVYVQDFVHIVLAKK